VATAASLVPGPIEITAARYRARTASKRAFLAHLALPPRLSLSAYSDQHRIISADSGAAEPGQWSTDRVPYMREPMDCISGREYQDITIVAPSQTAKTEVLNNAVAFYIDQEPSPVLFVAYSVEMAEAWSKERLAPMLRDMPRLRGKVKDPRSRDSGNTMRMKSYPGGYLAIVGSNAAAGLASRPIRVLLADELDRWQKSSGTEGDPLSLARARLKTFRHRKKEVKVSSPGNEGESRIEKEWEKSDQRHFYVPCPHCGEYQPLEWKDTEGKPNITSGRGDYRLVWDKVEEDGAVVHKPETAGYCCRKCGSIIEHTHKLTMLAAGRWVKHNPSSKLAGFHVSGLLSPWVSWADIATEWLSKKDDPEQRKTFFNTTLGLLYSEAGETADVTKLTGRREGWERDVPNGVGVLTMGVDVQGDRLEVLVMGWGHKEESSLIHFERLYGDPESQDVWERCDAILNREWMHEGGAPMLIRTCCVDSGHLADAVFRFVQPRQMRGVYATKGSDGLKVPMSRAQRGNRDKTKMFSFNPTTFKDVLFPRLKIASRGPGYIRIGNEEKTGVSEEFLLQFGAEKRLVEWKNGGRKVRYIELPGRRNEAIDLYNNNLVALRSLGATFIASLSHYAAAIAEEGARLEAERAAGPKETQPHRPRKSFVKGWR
jgi:phage terminase large subunit GpA-like protein